MNDSAPGRIESVSDLENVVGRVPPAIALKVIDHLDAMARIWIAHAPLAFIALGGETSVEVTLAGGHPGFAATEPGTLRLPLASIDHPERIEPGLGFGSLFLIPGLGETLRVNGRVAAIEADAAVVTIEECYGHCAKALIRSEFWQAQPVADTPGDAEGFVAASRFMALATGDAAGGTDLSPKGDPAGCMALLEDGATWFAERPGNRRTDSYRNLLTRPAMAGALLVPGSHKVAVLHGSAHLTTDQTRRARFAVRDKLPLLVACVEQARVELYESPALMRAQLWPAGPDTSGIVPAKVFAAHLKLNRDKGLGAKIASAMVSIPGLMTRALEKDYKSNLY